MSYKGSTKLWSSVNHFSGGFPSGTTPANTMMDAVVTAAKAAVGDHVTIVKASLYPAGSNVASFTKTYSTVGTVSGSGLVRIPGDCAALLRYSTTQLTSKNHPIYLFNYFHGGYAVSTTSQDTPSANWVTGLNGYGTAWLAGFSDGTNTYLRAGPNGAVAQARSVGAYITHRDFRK